MVDGKSFGIVLCVTIAAIAIFALIAFFKKNEDTRTFFKRLALGSIYLGIFAIITLLGVVSSFVYLSDYLLRVMEPESIETFRMFFKAIFGTESVFSSIQLIISFLMVTVSLLTGIFCAFAVESICRIFVNRLYHGGKQEKYHRQSAGVCFVSFNLPILYSRLLN